MKRMALAAGAAAMVLTACGGGGGGTAATVGESEITVEEVRAVPFETEGTMESAEFAQFLTALIQWQIIEDGAREDFGIEPTDEDVDAELDEIVSTLSPDLSIEELAEQQGLSVSTLRRLAETSFIQDAVAAELTAQAEPPTDQELSDARDEATANQTEVCVRHVLTETEEEAQTAKERLDDGEDFATVAEDLSTDPSAAENGGDLGCAQAGRYVPEFRDAAIAAEIDEITDPIESQFGFHVLQVYDRTEPADDSLPSDEELQTQLESTAQAEQFETWLLDQAADAEVTVDEEYGTWTTTPQPQVLPPGA